MIKNHMPPKKKACMLIAIFCIVLPVEAQTIVRVMAEQPPEFEITAPGELFIQTDTSFIFGTNLVISGGTEPYSYSWMKNGQLVNSSSTLEIVTPIGGDIYSLLVSDANKCTAGIYLTHYLEVKAANSRVSVYPQPASDFIIINPNEINDFLDISLYSSSGILIMKTQIRGETRLEIDLPSGIYILRIETEDKQWSGLQKIILL